MNDAQLLQEFRENKSHEAFSQLVSRHIGWIHAVARRRVGDEHLAHDVAQAVFLLLAERSDQIRNPHRLGAWLLKTTIFAANHAMREENRRRRRERVVAISHGEADMSAGQTQIFAKLALVETAVEKLDEADRSLISIRFYQGRSLADVGAELGISQDAARKRLERVIQHLRIRLTGRVEPADALPTLLASLTTINQLPYGGALPPVFALKTASLRAISISKGVSQMMMRDKLKKMAAVLVMTMVLGGGILLARGGEEPGESPPTAAASTDSPEREWTSSPYLAIVISKDGSKLTGYSKQTGQWAETDGKNFKIDDFVLTSGVAVCREGNTLLAFSYVTNTWDRIELPAGADTSIMDKPVVGDSDAAYAVRGAVFAYSPYTGTWVTLKVPDKEAVIPIIDENAVRATSDGKMYYFCLKTGKWSSGF